MTAIELISPELITEATAWRRDLHRHPELAFNERRTSDFIAGQLTRFGLKVHRGLAGTGVVGTLSRGTSQRTIGIRADMDALPIEEQTNAPHASSIKGVMHACGHDGHVAMVLAAASACSRMNDLDGTVHFIFQPAEEAEGGAPRMIEEGLFKLFPCDVIFGLHNWPALPLGQCVARDGAMMAANAVFEVKIRGRGCHGAMPHQGTDCILAGCQLVSSLQSIASRSVDPLQAAVVSATQFLAGDTSNVIPETCVIRGTTRWFDESIGALIERRFQELAMAIPAAFGCEATVHYQRRFPATVNDASAAQFVRRIAATPAVNLEVVDIPPSMGAEDFAYMLREIPGCYFWLGTGAPGCDFGLHSTRFDFNDEVLPQGLRLWTEIVRASLATSGNR